MHVGLGHDTVQEALIDPSARQRSEMSQMPLVVELLLHCGCDLLLVLQGGEGKKGIRGRDWLATQEMLGHGGAGEELIRGGVGSGDRPRDGAAGTPEALHALEVEAVLLEVTGDVLAGEAVDAHQLHYGLGDGVLDAEVGHGVDEAFVELRRPDEAGALEGTGGFVGGGAGKDGGGGVEVGGVEIEGRRRRGQLVWARKGDVEGEGKVGGDKGLGQRHELLRRR